MLGRRSSNGESRDRRMLLAPRGVYVCVCVCMCVWKKQTKKKKNGKKRSSLSKKRVFHWNWKPFERNLSIIVSR